MAERPKNPVGALESSLAEEAGHSDDYTAKLIARKKKNTRKRRYDHSFTCQNISMVTATVYNDNRLADDILRVPHYIRDEIREKTSTSADFREGAIEYYVQYSPQVTWPELAGELYYRECGKALAAARRFIKRTPETTLNLPNLNTLLERVSHDWYLIGAWMNIPRSKRDEIRSQHSGDVQHCSRACWELYLKDHPFPTWQGVAYALYQRDHFEELEVVLKKYLKDINLQDLCLEKLSNWLKSTSDIDTLPLRAKLKVELKDRL